MRPWRQSPSQSFPRSGRQSESTRLPLHRPMDALPYPSRPTARNKSGSTRPAFSRASPEAPPPGRLLSPLAKPNYLRGPPMATADSFARAGFPLQPPDDETPFVMWIPRPAHTTRLSRSLRPPSPRQAPRQSRGLLGLHDARTRHLRSKRRSGHRKRLDNRKSFSAEFRHARRFLRDADSFIRILRHESALHSTSLASELESKRSNG